MLIQLSKKGKLVFVQFSALLYMHKRFFFKGSKLGMVGGTKLTVDQTPTEILEALSVATGGKAKQETTK